jgi:hypothetical protein
MAIIPRAINVIITVFININPLKVNILKGFILNYSPSVDLSAGIIKRKQDSINN